MRQVRIHRFGGPEEMVLEELPTPEPGAGQALVRVEASGVNFVDVYQRTGLYPGELPRALGMEGAGVIETVGSGVSHVRKGDRVAWAMYPGSYATHAVIDASRLIPIPAALSFEQAAAAMLQGMTAHFLSHSTYPLGDEDTCLVHAAAGGVGRLLVQMAKRRGAKVIATCSASKVSIPKEAGADHVIAYDEEDFAAAVRKLEPDGVQVVYDSVGRATFDGSIDSLAMRGMMVLFGAASGPVDPIDPQLLNRKGSLFLTRPSLGHYTKERGELVWRAHDLLGWIAAGAITLKIDRTLPLREVAEAHRLLESRATAGKIVLLPHG